MYWSTIFNYKLKIIWIRLYIGFYPYSEGGPGSYIGISRPTPFVFCTSYTHISSYPAPVLPCNVPRTQSYDPYIYSDTEPIIKWNIAPVDEGCIFLVILKKKKKPLLMPSLIYIQYNYFFSGPWTVELNLLLIFLEILKNILVMFIYCFIHSFIAFCHSLLSHLVSIPEQHKFIW